MTGLGFLPRGLVPVSLHQLAIGLSDTIAFGVNADGSVVVGQSSSASGFEAFRWTSDGGMPGLCFLTGGSFSQANAVNADGSVVVGLSSIGGSFASQAFRWVKDAGLESGVMTDLGFLTGVASSAALGVNADGSVVIGWSDYVNGSSSGAQAFRWVKSANSATAGVMAGLGFLTGGFNSTANAVNADGSVVVGHSDSTSGFQAFRWTEVGGMQTVSQWLTNGGGSVPSGWTLDSATGVNADGTVVVGNGTHNSATEAWLARSGALVSLADLSASLRTGSYVPQSSSTMAETLRVETPWTYISAMASLRACSERRPFSRALG